MRRLLPWLALAIFLAGCSSDSPTGGGGGVSFGGEVQPIFDAHCGGCHPPNGGLDLSPAGSYVNLVSVMSSTYGQMRVQPGDPNNSVLYGKASGDFADGAMPPADLDPSQVETIRLWIQEGALDN